MTTDHSMGFLLEKIEKKPYYETFDVAKRRKIYLIRKSYDENVKLPENLIVETAKQEAIAVDSWKKAKAVKNFLMFRFELEKLVELKKRAAEILMDVKRTSTTYDALIDIYEPKMTAEKLTGIFDNLRKSLVLIIAKCQNRKEHLEMSLLQRRVPIDVQRKISNILVNTIDYDVESEMAGGRIDETEHPFTTGYYDDVRITTHYYEDNFASAIFSILHEGGHAIYEQGLRQEWMFQPIGSTCSLGFHESQSRLFENIIGRSKEFWTYFLPKLKELTGTTFTDVTLDDFVSAINQVKLSKIRIEADEATYCLHIIIRFEIERDLMAGKVTVAELPQIWNQKYKDYLGLEIKNDSEGLMQDTHWAKGLIGYFPTYALGNIYSGQIITKMQKDLSGWRKKVSEGNLHTIKQWLIENVYTYGNLYNPEDLIKKITMEEVNITHYLDYLNEKLSRIYKF
ncbi:MAG: carboxypeptidase Taq [Thermoproteota archaeon]|nr:carboxypeptidase Taq [Thermoproteota archaeon]